jgi:hypothetical protein
LVACETRTRVSSSPRWISSLDQTRAIVAQVEREIEQQVTREAVHPAPSLFVTPRRTITPRTRPKSMHAAGRFVLSLIPAGSL